MSGSNIRLLSLDSGGVVGLSSLFVLRHLMEKVNPEFPPKPCDYFDMIGGTGTGGIIAIMLGRLQMTVEECIEAYAFLSDKVFKENYSRISNGKMRFDSGKLKEAMTHILHTRNLNENEHWRDVDAKCKVFVCATSSPNKHICICNYQSPLDEKPDLLDSVTIWQTCLATSVATTFFEPDITRLCGETLVDNALRANNPIDILWKQAHDVWGENLRSKLQCIVSIGAGLPKTMSIAGDPLTFAATLRLLVSETESTARVFLFRNKSLEEEGRYYRFDVDTKFQYIGLEEAKRKGEIAAATKHYVESHTVARQMQACASTLAENKYFGPYRTVFSLMGVPTSSNFIDRPSDRNDIENHLLPQHIHPRRNQQLQCKVLVLLGLGGIGKTRLAANFSQRHQSTFSSVFWLDGRSEDRVKYSLAACAKRIPQDQLSEISRNIDLDSDDNLDIVVEDTLAWLAKPDNTEWLLVFDNVYDDQQQSAITGGFDIRRYLPADHGSVLITTRCGGLAQLGRVKGLEKANHDLSKAIFEKWYGKQLVQDEAGNELLRLLDGLPLALAQAAAYCRETGINVASYVRFYRPQRRDLAASVANFYRPFAVRLPASLETMFAITFEAIEQESKSAANLLRIWAFIAYKDLWHGMFKNATEYPEECPGWLYEIAENRAKFINIVRLLRRFSIVEARDDTQGSYSLHPMVHRWAANMQTIAEKKEFLQLAITIVGSAVPRHPNINYWILQRRLLPHADEFPCWINDLFGRDWLPNGEVILDSVLNLGFLYLDQHRRLDAETMQQRALLGLTNKLGSNHRSTLQAATNLGSLYRYQGKLAEAEAIYQRALEGYQMEFGSNHQMTLKTADTLLVLSRLIGSYEGQSIYDGDNSSTRSDPTASLWSQHEETGTSISQTQGTSIHQEEVAQPHQQLSLPYYKNPEIDSEIPAIDDDIESITSATDEIASQAESRLGNSAQWQVGVDIFASRLAADKDLLDLFTTAISSLSEERFVNNHRRLLKHLFVGHRSSVRLPSEKLAVELLRSRRRRTSISREIWNLFRKSGSAVLETIAILDERNQKQKVTLERYLKERDAGVHARASVEDVTSLSGDSRLAIPTLDDEDGLSDSEASGESEDEDKTEQPQSKLQSAAEFLTSGQPFELYKENLRDFLNLKSRVVEQPESSQSVDLRETNEFDAALSEADSDLRGTDEFDAAPSEADSDLRGTDEFDAAPSEADSDLRGTDEFDAAPSEADSLDCLLSVEQRCGTEEEAAWPTSMPLTLYRKMCNILRSYSEPSIPPGMTRIRWTCSCGDAMFDDFFELQPGALQALQLRLRQLHETDRSEDESRRSGRSGVRSAGDLLPAIRTGVFQRAASLVCKLRRPGSDLLPFYYRRTDNQVTPADDGQADTEVAPADDRQADTQVAPADDRQADTEVALTNNRKKLHILMCVDKGEHQTQLHQTRLPDLIQDKDFFKFLGRQYKRHRAFKSKFLLRGVKSVSLTRFALDHNDFASVHNHEDNCASSECICIPSRKRVVDDKEYQCDPAPREAPGHAPAIGTRFLTHYFFKPHDLRRPQRVIYNQLPKRTQVLASSPDSVVYGWGIHFKEGWHWVVIYRLAVILFVSDIVFLAIWFGLKGGASTGLAIAALVVTVEATVFGYIAARSL